MAEDSQFLAIRFETAMSELKETKLPLKAPDADHVRIRVVCCGICHSDVMTKYGVFGCTYPRAPGHEIAGVVDAVADDVKGFKPGDRVGVGWTAGFCGNCIFCRNGDTACCPDNKVPGLHFDGGYNEYVYVPTRAIARIPDQLSFEEAAPLMCAGITSYNSLRNSVAKPGDLVAVVGIGGLGHLAVQFANKMGFKVVAISRGSDKKELSLKLGAHYYLDSKSQNVGKELLALGGAKVVLVTATNPAALEGVVDGLGPRGQVLIVAALQEAMPVNTLTLLMKRASISGWASGGAQDSEDTMNFAALTGVRSINETFPISEANKAFDHALNGNPKFRVVLKVGQE